MMKMIINSLHFSRNTETTGGLLKFISRRYTVRILLCNIFVQFFFKIQNFRLLLNTDGMLITYSHLNQNSQLENSIIQFKICRSRWNTFFISANTLIAVSWRIHLSELVKAKFLLREVRPEAVTNVFHFYLCFSFNKISLSVSDIFTNWLLLGQTNRSP